MHLPLPTPSFLCRHWHQLVRYRQRRRPAVHQCPRRNPGLPATQHHGGGPPARPHRVCNGLPGHHHRAQLWCVAPSSHSACLSVCLCVCVSVLRACASLLRISVPSLHRFRQHRVMSTVEHGASVAADQRSLVCTRPSIPFTFPVLAPCSSSTLCLPMFHCQVHPPAPLWVCWLGILRMAAPRLSCRRSSCSLQVTTASPRFAHRSRCEHQRSLPSLSIPAQARTFLAAVRTLISLGLLVMLTCASYVDMCVHVCACHVRTYAGVVSAAPWCGYVPGPAGAGVPLLSGGAGQRQQSTAGAC